MYICANVASSVCVWQRASSAKSVLTTSAAATGTHNRTQTITTDGSSLFDINMGQLSHLLLPHEDPTEQSASDSLGESLEHQHESWLAHKAETVHCLLDSAACKLQPLATAAIRSAMTAISHEIEVSVLL